MSDVASADPIRFDEVRAWTFEHALPLWLDAGVDRAHGGAVEALGLDGRDAGFEYKRVRAQARQVYAFTHAHLMGVKGAAQAAEHVWGFLSDHARREDGAWVRQLTREGAVLDANADAYDTAFIIYALAWRARAGDEHAVREAHGALDGLEGRLGLGKGLGFAAAEDKPGARLQNPHMHLLEAAVEMADAGRDQRFAELARDIVELFSQRMLVGGVLVEEYGDGWAPVRGEGQRIEPGHLYEWTWLLHRAEAAAGRPLGREARGLCAFAERNGIDAELRLADDGLDGPGLVQRHTFRLWPQTEVLKAHLAMFEHQGLDTRGRVAEAVSLLLDRYLAVEPRGGFVDRLDGDGRPAADSIPSSIVYHLLVAFTELLRLEGALEKGDRHSFPNAD